MKNTELIKCPNSVCGQIQSREEYEKFCCWKCGSTLPIPKLQMFSPAPVIVTFEAPDSFDESRIKKMSDL